MDNPSSAEILKVSYERLIGNEPFKTLMQSRIYNHIPQEKPLPCCRVRWSQASEWDTKDSNGLEGYIFVDIWTDYRGDKISLQASDLVVNLLHLRPLQLSSSQSLLLRRDFIDAFTEGDGLTHHTVIRFRHIATT